jgi:hypothetical protein
VCRISRCRQDKIDPKGYLWVTQNVYEQANAKLRRRMRVAILIYIIQMEDTNHLAHRTNGGVAGASRPSCIPNCREPSHLVPRSTVLDRVIPTHTHQEGLVHHPGLAYANCPPDCRQPTHWVYASSLMPRTNTHPRAPQRFDPSDSDDDGQLVHPQGGVAYASCPPDCRRPSHLVPASSLLTRTNAHRRAPRDRDSDSDGTEQLVHPQGGVAYATCPPDCRQPNHLVPSSSLLARTNAHRGAPRDRDSSDRDSHDIDDAELLVHPQGGVAYATCPPDCRQPTHLVLASSLLTRTNAHRRAPRDSDSSNIDDAEQLVHPQGGVAYANCPPGCREPSHLVPASNLLTRTAANRNPDQLGGNDQLVHPQGGVAYANCPPGCRKTSHLVPASTLLTRTPANRNPDRLVHPQGGVAYANCPSDCREPSHLVPASTLLTRTPPNRTPDRERHQYKYLKYKYKYYTLRRTTHQPQQMV